MDCVPTSIAASLQYLTGKQYTGEELVHAVYGKNYKGGTAAIEYVSYCAKAGVKLSAISSNDPNYLVQQAHAQLALGHPALCTIPSSYTPPADRFNPGLSHCVVFYKDSPGVLAAMNPWQAFTQANTDSWWAARFCFGQVWIMEKGSMSGIPQGWKDNGSTLVAPNGKAITLGFRGWVLAHDWRADNAPLENAHGSDAGGTEQAFLNVRLRWTDKTGVYEQPYGQDYLQAVSNLQAAQAQVKTLQAKVDAAPTSTTEAEKQFLNSLIQSIQAEVGKLQ
jgi:hypothetical protein